MRSRAAAAMLDGEGFKEIFSMSGGMDEWNGLKAHGAPESGVAVFSEADSLEDLVGRAWILEEGSRAFYAGVVELLDETDASALFQELVKAEEHHKKSLLKLYEDIAGAGLASNIQKREETEDLMEGGIRVSEALSWAKGKNAWDILQFSMSVETNALDLYLNMIRHVHEEKSIQVFKGLAEEEKVHLERMGELLEKRV